MKSNFVVSNSKIHGKGLFAKKFIHKGEHIVDYVGEWINEEEADRRELENDKKGVTYIFYYDDDNLIDGAIGGNESIYINHCCDPNCEAECKDNRIMIFAIKDIKEGEEILIDYCFEADGKREPCLCGSPNCRGVMNEVK